MPENCHAGARQSKPVATAKPIWESKVKFKTHYFAWILVGSLFCVPLLLADDNDKASHEAALKRVTDDIKYLSSDELEGRAPGTDGIEMAAKRIEAEYKRIGLKPLEGDTYRQDFEVRRGRTLDDEKISLEFKGPNDTDMKLEFNKDFAPAVGSPTTELNADLVFVGYGITATELNYDEYKDVDAKDKIVVLIRREPQQENPDSVFDGTEVSRYAYINTKVAAARAAGAIGIIMVNDGVSTPDESKDVLEAPTRFESSLPFIQMKRSTLEKFMKQAPLLRPDGSKFESLSDVEKEIDKTLSPISQPLEGWKCTFTSGTKTNMAKTSNIVGIVEGEGPLADETIVIGGHYDHLGKGGAGSRAPGSTEIHNGADDNATGTAAVLELARRFAQRDEKPARRLVFMCFSAEEMGLLGAYHYVQEPLFPLEKTVAMVNFDMIGWLRDDKLTIYSADSAEEFGSILDKANEGIDLNLVKASGFAGSDHLPFIQKKIPVMFIHTGLTSTYHTPQDDFETINCGGALKVIDYSERVIDQLVGHPGKFTYAQAGSARSSVRLGILLNDDNEKGVEITRITEGSIADKAGLKVGDLITAIGDKKMETRRAITREIRAKTGETVKIKFLRGEEEKEVEVKLKNDG